MKWILSVAILASWSEGNVINEAADIRHQICRYSCEAPSTNLPGKKEICYTDCDVKHREEIKRCEAGKSRKGSCLYHGRQHVFTERETASLGKCIRRCVTRQATMQGWEATICQLQCRFGILTKNATGKCRQRKFPTEVITPTGSPEPPAELLTPPKQTNPTATQPTSEPPKPQESHISINPQPSYNPTVTQTTHELYKPTYNPIETQETHKETPEPQPSYKPTKTQEIHRETPEPEPTYNPTVTQETQRETPKPEPTYNPTVTQETQKETPKPEPTYNPTVTQETQKETPKPEPTYNPTVTQETQRETPKPQETPKNINQTSTKPNQSSKEMPKRSGPQTEQDIQEVEMLPVLKAVTNQTEEVESTSASAIPMYSVTPLLLLLAPFLL
ncbi:hypothetical protein DSO57_1023864 [Entomophthora muscae]|uniref:Uncharacterized protein n=1 Tax=Entomophthora muscae TaxID=34485 RepID=A0ACC2RTU3_9FUNG|nr:hypothetical protein DSO57_1023864 [Entomophthora muscae]